MTTPDRPMRKLGFRTVDDVAFALPFTFGHDDRVQILADITTVLAPLRGRSSAV